jgi:lysylphosphatidylglycerol synthetase-like protein (DUF2156 family)
MRDTVIWPLVLVYSFIALASACAVVAGLERILGRPIPRLRHSPPIRRNRAFVAVPAVMIVVFSWLLYGMLREPGCSDCTPGWRIYFTSEAFGFSGAVGWVVFALILVAIWIFRFASRLIPK